MISFLKSKIHSYDKHSEQQRYDQRALSLCENVPPCYGSSRLPPLLKQPYIDYESIISKLASQASKSLEIACGTGQFSYPLLANSGYTYFTDISSCSLNSLRASFNSFVNFDTLACDMENLPFDSESFDLVVCAGGLSYGCNKIVMQQILRVLKPNGHFVSVDTLNHNPIYIINRIFHFLLNHRTLSTLVRMPTFGLIRNYSLSFGSQAHVRYYGSFLFLLMPLSLILPENWLASVSLFLDKINPLAFLSFKYVMVIQKREQ